ncbi:hypothetical protein WIS52_21155 [Pseudonocardia nematodicida]|uniref:Uncharacterized protein n=1 Tax=Pseudonocardia nematodicida TaxID=1206997 RepID=A0ABV1KH88_9PSEU
MSTSGGSTVAGEELNQQERAVLFTLLAEGRELTNAQLHDAGGVRLDGAPRRRLNDRKLVESTRVGRAYVHELTDDGAAWCTAELSAERPARAGYLGGAFYAVLRGLGRSGVPLAELFPYRPDVEREIRHAYGRLAGPGEWVGLPRLRDEIGTGSRSDIDAALGTLAVAPGVHLQAEPNRRALTDRDREAAIVVGGEERHMIMIENG